MNNYREHRSLNSYTMKLIEKTQCYVIHGVFRMQQTQADVKCILRPKPPCVELCKVLTQVPSFSGTPEKITLQI